MCHRYQQLASIALTHREQEVLYPGTLDVDENAM